MKRQSSSPLHVYLVRHGETEWSITGQHTERTAIPLTADGESEARWLSTRLRDIPFMHVLNNPLRHTLHTCKLADLACAPEITPELLEWDYGDCEGKRSTEIREAVPDWNVYRNGCPHGEMSGDAFRSIVPMSLHRCSGSGAYKQFSAYLTVPPNLVVTHYPVLGELLIIAKIRTFT